jgi:rod shape-determining protein MreC
MPKGQEGLARLGDKLVLGICVALSIALITQDDPTRLRLGSRWAQRLMTPVETVFDHFDSLRDVRAENERLRTRIAAMQLDAGQILAERARWEELRARAGFYERSRGSLLPATVLQLEIGRFPTRAKIRCTEVDSLRRFLAVVTEKGLVGRISEVLEPDIAMVELLTDLESRISVEDVRTGVVGLLRYDGHRFMMDQVPRGEPLKVGDIINTSGLGATVPRGLPVGEIEELRSSPSELFQSVFLRPFTRFHALDDVYVVWREGPWYVRPADAELMAPADSLGRGGRG